MDFLSIKEADVEGKRVIVRAGFDVPLDKDGNVVDDNRIRESVPTIKYLSEQGAIVIVISHNGRPKGQVVENLKMDKVAECLGKILGQKAHKLDDCVGHDVEDFIQEMSIGEVVVLENLRFYEEEEENDDEFAEQLSQLGDIYVNDAFAVCHRAHASIVGIPKFLPSYAGFLVEKELNVMGRALQNPEHPFIAILGGAKVSDKLGVIKNLLKKVDKLLIGGAMTFTFLKAKGLETGNSLVEDGKIEEAQELLKNEKLVLPVDIVSADKFEETAESRVVSADGIDKESIGLDIGPETIEAYKKFLKNAKTVVWNGPLGKFEWEKFANGTDQIALFLAGLDAVTIIGGGDSAAAVEKLGIEDKFTHISTGGGASLEFFEGKKLPGIAALEESMKKFEL